MAPNPEGLDLAEPAAERPRHHAKITVLGKSPAGTPQFQLVVDMDFTERRQLAAIARGMKEAMDVLQGQEPPPPGPSPFPYPPAPAPAALDDPPSPLDGSSQLMA